MTRFRLFSRSKMIFDKSYFKNERTLVISQYDVEPRKIENVFSQQELDLLRTLAEKSSNRDVRPGSRNIYVDRSELDPIIMSKIKNWIPPGGRVSGAFNVTTFPFPPHTDMPSDPDNPYIIQFIVPIATWGKGAECSVVFFHQRYFGPNRSPLFQLPEDDILEWHRNRSKYIVNYDLNHSIEESLLKGPLANLNPLLLTGLSVSDVITYKPGDLIIFGGSRIHCSGDLHFHGQLAKLILLPRVVMPLGKHPHASLNNK